MTEVAGRMDTVVELSELITVDDGEGGGTVSYTPLSPACVPAAVLSLRSEERLQAQASETLATHTVLLRWHPSVGPRTRLTWGTRVLDVVGPPIEVGRRARLKLLCVERCL